MIQILLKSARVNSGLSSKKAAELLGIHFQTLLKYEKDSTDISISLLEKMCILYQIPEDYIFLGKEYELIRNLEKKRKAEIA